MIRVETFPEDMRGQSFIYCMPYELFVVVKFCRLAETVNDLPYYVTRMINAMPKPPYSDDDLDYLIRLQDHLTMWIEDDCRSRIIEPKEERLAHTPSVFCCFDWEQILYLEHKLSPSNDYRKPKLI